MVKRKVRIEEIMVSHDEEFSKNVWIESDTLEYAATINHENDRWIVVEVK